LIYPVAPGKLQPSAAPAAPNRFKLTCHPWRRAANAPPGTGRTASSITRRTRGPTSCDTPGGCSGRKRLSCCLRCSRLSFCRHVRREIAYAGRGPPPSRGCASSPQTSSCICSMCRSITVPGTQRVGHARLAAGRAGPFQGRAYLRPGGEGNEV